MKMAKITAMILTVLTAGMIISCSNYDGAEMASYEFKGQKHSFVVGDVRKELFYYAVQKRIAPEDLNGLKSFITENLVIMELKAMDMIESGYTNKPEFKTEYEKAEKQMFYSLLNRFGNELLRKQLQEGQFLLARASHILLSVPSTYMTNGTNAALDPAVVEQKWKENEAIAKNTIESLKMAKDLDKEFAMLAQGMSHDPGSAARGGDLGYFPDGQMVPEFSSAVFAMKGKGLVTQPVKTTYGYHIIYVTTPPKMLSFKDLENEVGQEAGRTWYAIENSLKSVNMKDLFTVDIKNTNITVDGKQYSIVSLPDDTKLVEIWGTPYTWAKCREIIDLFVPGFSQNLTITSFAEQIKNCKEFMFYAEKALKEGLDKKPEFAKEYANNKKNIIVDFCAGAMDKEFAEQAKGMIKYAELTNYYNTVKMTMFQQAKKDKKGLVVTNKATKTPVMETLPFTQVSNTILMQLANNSQMQLINQWKEGVFKKYNVVVSDEGIKTLSKAIKEDVDNYMKEQEKKKKDWEEKQKKMMQEQQKAQGGQPQGQPQVQPKIQVQPQPGK